jgi:hypothetical protein
MTTEAGGGGNREVRRRGTIASKVVVIGQEGKEFAEANTYRI